jgi:CheY-like chemotaxis protein
MDTTLTRPRVLVLKGLEGPGGALPAHLSEWCDPVVAADLPEAVRLLQRGSYDAVLVHPELLPASDKSPLASRLMLMLDRIGEGVCLAGEDGEALWSNRVLRDWGPSTAAQVRECCRQAARSGRKGETRFCITDDQGRHLEILSNPVHDPVEGANRVLAIVRDETEQRRLQQKMDALDRAGRELVRIDRETIARLDMPQRLAMLEEKVIRSAHDLLEFDHFNIRLLDKKTNRLHSVISTGLSARNDQRELLALPTGNGISGYVAATGKSYICRDILTDPLYLPGLEQARSSLTVPLRLQDEVVGVFNIESLQAERFREEDRQFAEMFGRYVAIALNILELMVVERHRTTGRLAEDVAHEISGPLNDILTDTAALMESEPPPAFKKRLADIMTGVDRIRAGLKSACESTGGLLGAVAGRPAERDPLLEGKRVLVADDEAVIRETIGDVLTGCGCLCDQAGDGAQAAALIEQRPYDLVISDIRMPHKNGYEVFAAAKARNAATAVILITGFGYDPNHSIVKARREGLAAVLFKPFKVAMLLEQVRAALTAGAAPPPGA